MAVILSNHICAQITALKMTVKVRNFVRKATCGSVAVSLLVFKYPRLSFASRNSEMHFGDTVSAAFPYGSVPF
jgi:hypothetical protein